jgi:hypothetical protein
MFPLVWELAENPAPIYIKSGSGALMCLERAALPIQLALTRPV